MDTTVAGIGTVVVAQLRAAGYMESTIGQYEKTIKALTGFVEERGGTYTPSLGAAFASLTISPRTGRFSAQRSFDYRRLVGVFDSYVATGRVDLSCRKRGGGGARPVSVEFTALAAAWEADLADRGLAPATCDAYGRVARGWLVFLESRGIDCLADADGASVLGFLASLSGRWATSSLFWVVSNFRPFLTFTGRSDLVEAVGLAGVQRSHAIVPVLDDDDERLVVQACASGVIAARDAAITLLALTTGLRACDIVNLRLADVDWRGQTIGIVQQKTHNPLTVPLTDLLVGRLADYVLDQRPDSHDDHVFLRSVAPHTRLADHASIHRVITETFRAAGVVDVKAGTRLLRHNAASRLLLRAAVPLPTISAVLGHASPESTNLYHLSERRPGPAARVRARRARRCAVMNAHGFTSALAPELDAYMTFKEMMGCYGTSRIWYLRQFDAYCTAHHRAAFDRDTVEGWVAEQLTRSGRYRSWMSYIRDVGRWLQAHGRGDAYVLSDRWKAPLVPAHPYLLSRAEIEAFFAAAARLNAHSPWRWQAVAFFTLMHSCGLRTGETRLLRPEHVHLPDRHLDVVSSKGNRSRRLPLTARSPRSWPVATGNRPHGSARHGARSSSPRPATRSRPRPSGRSSTASGTRRACRARREVNSRDRTTFAITSPTPTSNDGQRRAAMSPRCCPTSPATWGTRASSRATTTSTPRRSSWTPTPTSRPAASRYCPRSGSNEARPGNRRTGLLRLRPRLPAHLPAHGGPTHTEHDRGLPDQLGMLPRLPGPSPAHRTCPRQL
jgi:integrase